MILIISLVIFLTACDTSYNKTKKLAIIPEDHYGKIFLDSRSNKNLMLSPNGQNVAYTIWKDGKALVFLNGENIKTYDIVSWVQFSPINQLVYIATVNNRSFVVIGGKEGKAYAEIGFGVYGNRYKNPLRFNPDGQIAYVARRFEDIPVDGRDLDGLDRERYDNITDLQENLAPLLGKRFVVVDGKEGKLYDQISENDFNFIADGKQFSYMARNDHKWEIVIVENDEEISIYEEENKPGDFSLINSPDGKRLAYRVRLSTNSHIVVVDDQEYGPYDSVSMRSRFSADSKKLVFGAQLGDEAFVVIEGKEDKHFIGTIFPGSIVISPDSQNIAYVANRRARKDIYVILDNDEIVKARNDVNLVVNGLEGKPYHRIGPLVFSPNSQQLVYDAESDKPQQHVMVVSGKDKRVIGGKDTRFIFAKEEKEYTTYDGVQPVFSPDSQRLAYGIQGRHPSINSMAVVDRLEFVYDGFAKISLPIFSPDSKHVAYAVSNLVDGEFVVFDGVEGKKYDKILKRGIWPDFNFITFSPDSKYLSYNALDGNQSWYVVEELDPTAGNLYLYLQCKNNPGTMDTKLSYSLRNALCNEKLESINGLVKFDNDTVQVNIRLEEINYEIIKRLKQNEFEIETTNEELSTIQGWISITKLGDIEQIEEVKKISLPDYGITR